MTFRLVLDFATDEDRDNWIGWYLDGGGQQGFNDACDSRGDPTLGSNCPNGKHWDWQKRSGGDKRKPPLPEYKILLRRYDDD